MQAVHLEALWRDAQLSTQFKSHISARHLCLRWNFSLRSRERLEVQTVNIARLPFLVSFSSLHFNSTMFFILCCALCRFMSLNYYWYLKIIKRKNNSHLSSQFTTFQLFADMTVCQLFSLSPFINRSVFLYQFVFKMYVSKDISISKYVSFINLNTYLPSYLFTSPPI